MGRIVRCKKTIFEFLSLGSPRAVAFDFSAIIITLAVIPTAFLGEKGGICIWHNFVLQLIFKYDCPETGVFAHCYCPGCGLTHAFSAILHGKFQDTLEYNHFSFLVFILVLFFTGFNAIKLMNNKS